MLLTASCGVRGAQLATPAERESGRIELEAFEAFWLEPARVAPPTIDFDWQEVEAEGVRVRVRPLLPEDADWNRWTGGEARLFNNRAGLLFEVEADGPRPLDWMPGLSRLELNDETHVLPAARSPDALLLPLQSAALAEARLVLDGDLAERLQAAGPYRAAYLAPRPGSDALRGVIAFPYAEPEVHVLVLRLTLALTTGAGPREVQFVYD